MASTLRELIARHHPLVVPSIYDGISALMLREFGFEAAYIGSYATGATRYGRTWDNGISHLPSPAPANCN